MGRLIVVSNRLPFTLKREGGMWRAEASSGGLATAMDPILKQNGGVWIGWSGENEPMDRQERDRLMGGKSTGYCYRPVDITPEVARAFYEGYPNAALWPLFHFFPARMRFDPGGWDYYLQGNRRFCDAVVREARPGDLIWVHDYHLMLLPCMLRHQLPEARIGFFLHIPFPSSEVFSMLPQRDEVLSGLLGADLIAFHTHRDVHHFRSSLLRVLGIESGINVLEHDGRSIRLEAMPIGIAPEEFLTLVRDDPDTAAIYTDLTGRYAGQHVLLAVDRLDYTKGVPQRLRTMRRLLESEPSLRGKVTLIQVAVPSREGIGTYQELRDEVNQLVGEINGKLGASGWTPVVYINQSIDRKELAALYKLADVAWVTPLRDGMNLVAKEYCASKPEGDGVLVLSEFAGAAAEMGEALLVNPYDEERVAETLLRALQLDEEDRTARMQALHSRVLRKDVFAWARGFIAALETDTETTRTARRPVDAEEWKGHYAAASRRVLILDYDGTLAPYARRPEEAAPRPPVLHLLRRLASDPANCVALVSGRRTADLERWFGAIPGLVLAAEHGGFVRESGQWRTLRPGVHTPVWKDQVRPMLDQVVDRTPGSFVEEKEFSIVWHYRTAEPEFAEWMASELMAILEGMLADTEARPVRGHKNVEIRPSWANKGEFASWLLNECGEAAFYLAAGDDRTDEDIYARMPEGSLTVRVGPGATRAQYRVRDARAMVALVEAITAE